MDERVKEIKERWDYPNADKLDWNNAKDDIGTLLLCIKELETENIQFAKWVQINASETGEQKVRAEKAESRIKELEQIMTEDPDHWDGAYVKFATEKAESKAKELEEGIEKVLSLPKIKKPLEFTFEKERVVIYLPKELYEELQKLIEKK